MSPVTRSANRPRASTSRRTLDDDNVPKPRRDAVRNVAPTDEDSTIQSLLKRALGGAKHLERENQSLRQKVKTLEDKLARLEDDDDAPNLPKRGKRNSAAVSELEKEVRVLRTRVRKLEKTDERQRRKLHELKMREVRKDADELAEDYAEFEVGDSAHTMRKLLREFQDLMYANALGAEENCPICFEDLKPKDARSFPCQHVLCGDCVKQLKPDPESYADDVESIRCPECRQLCPRDELEVVEFTAQEQWDELLKVAKEWAKNDLVGRRQDDTSEEEDEEEFIDDGATNEASTTASEAADLESTPEAGDEKAEPRTPSRLRKRTVVQSPGASPGTDDRPQDTVEQPVDLAPESLSDAETPSSPEAGPSSRNAPSYAQSPQKVKRKLLQELAEARAKKPRL